MQLKTLAQLLSEGTFRCEPDPGKERVGRGERQDEPDSVKSGCLQIKKNFFPKLTTGRCSGGE